MNDRIPVRQLLELLPDLAEFDPLRQALRKASADDTLGKWEGWASYSTVDTRVISSSLIGSALMDAEAEMRRRLKRLYDATNIAFSAVAAGSANDKARQLVVLGEASESAEQWREALAFFMLAHGITRTSTDLTLRALVLRRVGRASLHAGDFSRSAHFYSNSLATASIANDTEGQLVAATGLGNLAAWQGRWSEADDFFARAIALAGTEFPRERGQLLINRSVTARERRMLAQARTFLDEARGLWDDLGSLDRAGWYNNMGLLLLETDDLESARLHFEHALHDEPTYYDRSMVLDNLSEVALKLGNIPLALARAREAEEFAAAHGSPRALAQIYMQLGRIARSIGDSTGVAFFDKAIEITVGKPYPLLIGEIYYEFGLFRRAFGEVSSARELWRQALAIFAEMGATTHVRMVEAELEATIS